MPGLPVGAHRRTIRSRPPRLPRRYRGIALGGLWLRIAAFAQAPMLDEDLARGVHPSTSDALSLRAGQLRSTAQRHEMAAGLEGAIELAKRAPGLRYQSLICATEARRCESLLRELAARLRDDDALNAKGLAMCSVLIHSANSPLCNRYARRPLASTIRSALLALDGPPYT